MKSDEGKLVRIYRPEADQEVQAYAFLDDYAFVAEGLISLYEASFNENGYLQHGICVNMLSRISMIPEPACSFLLQSMIWT